MLSIEPPKDTPEYAHPAYFSCLMWAAGNKDVTDAFQRDENVVLPKSLFDHKIDESTGYGEATAKKFLIWFNKNVWGKWDGKNEGQVSDREEAPAPLGRSAILGVDEAPVK